MELLQKALLALAVLAITFPLQVILEYFIKRSRALHLFPKGPPGCWPILGHLPFLADGCPHHALATLSRSPGYDHIVGLRLGSRLAVVVCSADLARELLFTQDKAFANRAHFQYADYVFYGFNVAIAVGNYGPRWVKLRRICTLELFTAKRLQELHHVRQEEVGSLLHRLFQASCHGTQAVDLGECLMKTSANTISRLLHSKTLTEVGGDSYTEFLAEQEREIAPTIGDFIPLLKFLDGRRKRKMQHIHDRVDTLIENILSERRQAMKTRQAHDQLPQDFIQVLLSKEASNHEKGDQRHEFPEEELITTKEIKGIMFDMLSAGTHSTALTLEWAMAELLRNPGCLSKLRDEIDAVMGKGNEQLVSDEDIAKLPYLENTVKEVFRLHPVVPLLFPHISHTEAKVDKYTLPANTLVFVNVWAVGRDPGVWENAEAFMPERFEGREVDVRGQHFELLPFGAGRRMCPAVRLALSVVHVTLANLVKAFEWELPHGQSHTDMDMSERRGVTSCRNTPLLLIPKPRLKS